MYDKIKEMTSKYFIGQPLFKHHPLLPEGMYYRYQNREHLVMLVSPSVSSPSVNNRLLSCPAEFAFSFQDGILFFLARFGHYHWRRAPYDWHRVPLSQRYLPTEVERSDGSTELHILLVDDIIGCVQGIRTVVFPPDFTFLLHQAIKKQAELPDIGRNHYRESLLRLQEKYPRAKDLLATALARTTDDPLNPTFWKNSHFESERSVETQLANH